MSEAYKSAGVDIDAGELFARMIKERIARAWGQDSAKEIGGFAGGGPIPEGAKLIKASVDGVGTKLHLLSLMDMLEVAGRDAVAMACDTYYAGNMPAFVLDHLSVEKLDPERHIKVIDGVIDGCLKAGCRLIGGETAEEPGTYRYPWRFNIDVTMIGFPSPELSFAQVEPGQMVYGWHSDFPGANGFSLLRRAFKLDDSPQKVRQRLERYWPELGSTLAEALLGPTPIWVDAIEDYRKSGVIFSGHAHITGGGMVENIPRILPSNLKVVIDRRQWRRPAIFRLAQDLGNVTGAEMDRTFNQGVMVVSLVSQNGGFGAIDLGDRRVSLIGRVNRRLGYEPQVEFVDKYNGE